MTKNNIIKGINEQLAGELLTYNELEIFLDEVIDNINAELDTCFPSFSEFTVDAYPEQYPDYNFFPDRYIRSVVIKGAAYKFYIQDEEGIQTAQQYGYNYQDELFKMLRDYLEDVPEEFKADHVASVRLDDVAFRPDFVFEEEKHDKPPAKLCGDSENKFVMTDKDKEDIAKMVVEMLTAKGGI